MSKITKNYKLHQFTLLIFLLLVFAFANSAGSFVSILALLIVVLCRMFSLHVSLEMLGLIALVVAVSTRKRLLPSVRLYVSF